MVGKWGFILLSAAVKVDTLTAVPLATCRCHWCWTQISIHVFVLPVFCLQCVHSVQFINNILLSPGRFFLEGGGGREGGGGVASEMNAD